jgi:competence protein ComEA
MSSIDLKENEAAPDVSDSFAAEDEKPEGRELFEFDPNQATEQNFQALGLTSWQIKIINNYRKRGGIFRNADDFGKIYGIGKIQFETLKPYIHFQSNPSHEKTDTFKLKLIDKKPMFQTESIQFEINSCDSTELDKLHGIGKLLATRIIKYRDRLGGFVKLDQMLEVYGLKTETFSAFLPHLTIDTTLVHKLKLNSIEYVDLKKHPYLTPFQAKSIIKYRELKGPLKETDLVKNNLLKGEELAKIKPYLSFE